MEHIPPKMEMVIGFNGDALLFKKEKSRLAIFVHPRGQHFFSGVNLELMDDLLPSPTFFKANGYSRIYITPAVSSSRIQLMNSK